MSQSLSSCTLTVINQDACMHAMHGIEHAGFFSVPKFDSLANYIFAGEGYLGAIIFLRQQPRACMNACMHAWNRACRPVLHPAARIHQVRRRRSGTPAQRIMRCERVSYDGMRAHMGDMPHALRNMCNACMLMLSTTCPHVGCVREVLMAHNQKSSACHVRTPAKS